MEIVGGLSLNLHCQWPNPEVLSFRQVADSFCTCRQERPNAFPTLKTKPPVEKLILS